jgi:ribosomal protein S18 acetylase RimI-like enzyme
MRNHGVATATMVTIAGNENNSVALYEKAGYEVVSRKPRFRKPVGAVDRARPSA